MPETFAPTLAAAQARIAAVRPAAYARPRTTAGHPRQTTPPQDARYARRGAKSRLPELRKC
jgi:hypothetical protein